MKRLRNRLVKNIHYLCIVSVIALGLITIIGSGGDGGGGDSPACPTPGEWSGSADFGELSFTVNDTSTGINVITFNWIDFTCGNVTRNGSITVSVSTPWPITDSQFTIEYIDSFDDFEIILSGTFDETCTNVSGTWVADSLGTICSGTWDASTL